MHSSHGSNRLILTPEQSNILLKVTGIKVKNRTRSQAQCHCPYHNDKHPSLSVNLVKGVYHCHSCKRSGTLPQLVYDLTGNGARRYLDIKDEHVSEDYDTDTPGALLRMAQFYADEQTPEEIIEGYSKLAPPSQSSTTIHWSRSKDVQQWMRERKVPAMTANDWEFSYAIRNVYTSSVTPDYGEDPSILTANRRLIVPLYGPAGNWVSVEARALNKDVPAKSLYIKPIDFLFRYPFLDKSKPVFVCEGLVDAARLYPYETNVTYLFGSSLTEIKKKLLSTFPYVVVIPDNDAPGYRLVMHYVESGLKVKIKQVPDHAEDLGDSSLTNSYIGTWYRSQPEVELKPSQIDMIINNYERLKLEKESDEFSRTIAFRETIPSR